MTAEYKRARKEGRGVDWACRFCNPVQYAKDLASKVADTLRRPSRAHKIPARFRNSPKVAYMMILLLLL